jgi:ATP-dependent DNA helicase RecG
MNPVTEVKYVGPAIANHLEKLGIKTVEDLLYHFPHKYLDLSRIKQIGNLRSGDTVTVVGEIKEVKKWRSKRGLQVINVSVSDGTGYITGTWFNQAYIANRLKEGMRVAFSGKVEYKTRLLQITNPFYDILGEDKARGRARGKEATSGIQVNRDKSDTVNSGRIIPVHPASQNLTTNTIRRIMKEAIDEFCNPGAFPDIIPSKIRSEKELMHKAQAIREVHFPSGREMLLKARASLIFEELFLMQVGLAARKKRYSTTLKGIEHKIDGELVNRLYNILPFQLTGDQKRVIEEIQADMARPAPMNRLLQGEVGSGKTMVALAALLTAVQSGYQATMMAPTEVLANQHYTKIKALLDSLEVRTALLTGALTQKERDSLSADIGNGTVDVVVGTHAIIQESVDFFRLGVVVVDEQHRFGVEQRMTLKEKGLYPDVLAMSATPIPRTLSLTLYGDLDVSIIKELPGGRRIDEHVKTVLCKPEHHDKAYQKIRNEIAAGRQAYIVCPLVEESDKIEVKAVMEEAERLKSEVFPNLRVGLIHGRLKAKEKEGTMRAFSEGDLDILISTTVIEVGVDVPNATVMLIEDADRFGLAQLHQLRGRVGRGGHKSFCILFAALSTEDSRQRIEAICNINDGFLLAEADLRIRGEGQLFGTRQSGLPDLKIAKLLRDIDILSEARKEAFALVNNDRYLAETENKPLLTEVVRKFGNDLDWLFRS